MYLDIVQEEKKIDSSRLLTSGLTSFILCSSVLPKCFALSIHFFLLNKEPWQLALPTTDYVHSLFVLYVHPFLSFVVVVINRENTNI